MITPKPERSPRWRLVRGWLITLATLTGAAAVIVVVVILNAPETPPPPPPGTNVLLTTIRKGSGSGWPDVPHDLSGASSNEVNDCWVGWGPGPSFAGITTDSVSVRVFQGTQSYPKPSGTTSDSPNITRGPNQNTWDEFYNLKDAKVGHTYRHGPVIIEVLGVWESTKHKDDKRGYLRVTFDESKIVCPPLPAKTVEDSAR